MGQKTLFYIFASVKKQSNNVYLTSFWVLTLLVVLCVQVLPISHFSCDADLIEVVDFDESESDEKENKEVEDDNKKIRSGFSEFGTFKHSATAASFGYCDGFPAPAFLEILSPPPELV